MRFNLRFAQPARQLAMGLVLVGMAAPAAATITISSSAYNVAVDLRVLNATLLSLGPVRTLGGSAGGAGNAPAYNLNTNPAAINASLGSITELDVTTGLLNLQASSPYAASPTGTALASTANINLALLLDPLIGATTNLLTIAASEIRSTSSVEGFGGPSASGSSLLTGLGISGSLLNGQTINGSLFVNPGANTVLLDLANIRITLNEQIRTGSATAGAAGITTNALHVQLREALIGANLVSGDIIISQSRANYFNDNPSFVPEPAVWLQLIVGFGAVGAITRRQRAVPALA